MVSTLVRIGDKILLHSPLILSTCTRGIVQGGHEPLHGGSGAAASSWTSGPGDAVVGRGTGSR
jgi:hypothetical protein